MNEKGEIRHFRSSEDAAALGYETLTAIEAAAMAGLPQHERPAALRLMRQEDLSGVKPAHEKLMAAIDYRPNPAPDTAATRRVPAPLTYDRPRKFKKRLRVSR